MSPASKELVVVLYGQPVGTIARKGPRLTLIYDPDYLAGANPTPLSLSMPLAAQPYANRYVEAHLRGLLPDHAEVRARWASHFGLQEVPVRRRPLRPGRDGRRDPGHPRDGARPPRADRPDPPESRAAVRGDARGAGSNAPGRQTDRGSGAHRAGGRRSALRPAPARHQDW
ncbi:HipA N-terminal domain-containing protein [Cellulomonas sp. NS3]|uniref:HipA N-terminal domain-containing protein n=1 Tax=Cellulomonas sp. NS3 TaxID=2973977 RepID=UPI002867C376|nr:HipA N-terminal domain-containing protein [Cellulomonas sp. NS3]